MYLSIDANSAISTPSLSGVRSTLFLVEVGAFSFFCFFALGRTGDCSGSSSSESTLDFVLSRPRFLGSCLRDSVDLRGFVAAFFAAAFSLARFSSKYLEISSSAFLHRSES